MEKIAMTEDEFFDDYERSFSLPKLERIYFGTKEWEGINIPVGIYIYKNKVWQIEQYPNGSWGRSAPAPYWTIKFFRENLKKYKKLRYNLYMKIDGRFRLELDIRYGDGSGGLRKSCHDDPEDVILAFLAGLQEPNPDYATTGSWFETYAIYDLEKNKEYNSIDKYIDEMHNEKSPNDDWTHPLTGGLISLANREIYHRAVKNALKAAEIYQMEYYNSKQKEGQFEYKCWKCGKPLTDANRSPLVYLSFPPKYACLDCDKGVI